MSSVIYSLIYRNTKYSSFTISLLVHSLFLYILIQVPFTSNKKELEQESIQNSITVSLSMYQASTEDKSSVINKAIQKKQLQKPHAIKPHAKKQQVKKKTKEKKIPKKQIIKEIVAQQTTPKSAPVQTKVIEEESKEDISSSVYAHKSGSTITKSKSSSQTKELDKKLLQHIRILIKNNLVYPKLAKRMRHEGVVNVSFVLKKNGLVLDANIQKSSGKSILDKQALKTVLALSGHYPKVQNSIKVSIPISFSIHKS